MVKIFFHIIIYLLFFLLSSVTYAKSQQEQVNNFVSNILVNTDASIDVTENITVFANQNKIIHGLVRWLPTQYYDSYGVLHHSYYQIRNVLVNNQVSPYHTENYFDRFAIYIGDRDVTIPSGIYTYTIQYHVNSAVNFLKDQDEFYWNITGNDWQFPIVRAEAIVQLPNTANIINSSAYTGRVGSKDQNFSQQLLSQNKISFVTTNPLTPAEGLTIAVSWPKGVVHSPTLSEKLKWGYQANKSNSIIFEICLLVLIYYLITWYFYGRDLRSGTIIPLYEPPLKLSPAVLRYISRMGFDMQTFTTALISIATKGFFNIQDNNDNFTLIKKTDNLDLLSIEEKSTVEKLFNPDSSIELSPDNSSTISAARSALKNSLKSQFKNIYFVTNSKYFIQGVLISTLALLVVSISSPKGSGTFFALMWLAMWTFACYNLASIAVNEILLAFQYVTFSNIARALRLSFLALPFLACEVVVIFMFITSGIATAMTMILLFMIVILNIIFYRLLKVPTDDGRKLMNQIDGFKLFLSTTERYRLDQLTPPEITPELFEKYLPYAVALNVANEWGVKFNNSLARANLDTRSYQPTWYSGTAWSITSVGAMTSYINSSIASSSSSSASSGGGSSGGGGGGGGGGGW